MTRQKYRGARFLWLLALFLINCSGNKKMAEGLSGAPHAADEDIDDLQAMEEKQYDFMIFASEYSGGQYGMAQVTEDAVARLRHDAEGTAYEGSFISSSNIDIQRSIVYDMLSRKLTNVMYFLTENLYETVSLALRYPKQKFVLPYSFTVSQDQLPDNLRIASIRMEQGAFIAGIIAGMMTRNNRVGMLTDLNDKSSELTMYAYVQGIRKANPDCEVVIVRTNSAKHMVENETTRMIASDGIDIVFAMSSNYNETIIGATYYLGTNVFIINGWYDADARWPRHVVTSLMISVDHIVKDYLDHSDTLSDFGSLPPVRYYDFSDEKTMTFSWDHQVDTPFEKAQPEYSERSKNTRRAVTKWRKKIRNKQFLVYNALGNSASSLNLHDFRYRDSRTVNDRLE